MVSLLVIVLLVVAELIAVIAISMLAWRWKC